MTKVHALCEQCRVERAQWRSGGDKGSPGCAGLFRSWFAGDAEAWGCVSEIFDPLLTRWVSGRLAQLGSQRVLTAEDVPEIVHDVHVRLGKYARRYPDKAAQLVEGENISKVLGFVKTTTKRRVLEIFRQRGGYHVGPLRLDDGFEQEGGEQSSRVAGPSVPSFSDRVIDGTFIEEALRRCLSTEAEKVVALEILLCRVRSREVLELYPHLFADIDSVYETTRQVRECLRQTRNELNADDRHDEDVEQLPLAVLAQSLLKCTHEQLPEWIEAHRSQLSLALLWYIRDNYAGNNFAVKDPLLSDCATSNALVLAEAMPHEPLALPIANWARGDWAMFHMPSEAIRLYRLAVTGFSDASADRLYIARIMLALIGVLTECSHYDEAEEAYSQALPLIKEFADSYPRFYLRLQLNYGWLRYNRGMHEQALGIFEDAITVAVASGQGDIATELGVNRALTLGMLGRLADVEAELWEKREAASANGDQLTVARIDLNLGIFYSAVGRPAEALHAFHEAHQAFRKLANQLDQGTVLLWRALLLQRLGSRRAAIDDYRRVISLFGESAMPNYVGEAMVYQATALRLEREYRRAEKLLAAAQEHWLGLNNPYWLARVLLEEIALALACKNYGQALALAQTPLPKETNPQIQAEQRLLQAESLRLADPETAAEAEEIYRQTIEYSQQQNNRWLQRQALAGLGMLYADRAAGSDRYWGLANNFLEQAIEIDDNMRRSLTIEELKSGFQAQASELFTPLIKLALAADDAKAVLRYVWRIKGSAFIDLAQRIEEEHTSQPENLQELQTVQQQLSTLRWQQAISSAGTHTDRQREQEDQAIAALVDRLRELRLRGNRSTGTVAQNPIHDTDQVLQRMDSDVLLEYVRCDNRILGIRADRRGQCLVVPLTDMETLDGLLRRWRLKSQHVVRSDRLQRHSLLKVWRDESSPVLEECYNRLIEPLLGSSEPGRILVAPCSPLFRLPFSAFRRQGRYLIEVSEIEYIQTGALIGLPKPSAAGYSSPFFAASSAGRATAMRDESLRAAEKWPGAVARIDVPARDNLRSLTSPPKFLHIGAHSILREDAPLLHGLQLMSEVLSVEECYRLPVAGSEFVALFGCSTMEGLETGGALLAFQSAFLLAGAQRVLASLWPAADDATAAWISHFYPLIASGHGVPQAVQRTQMALLADPEFAHPALWAAFASSRR